MAKIEVKKVQATMTVDDRELHWEAVVCYGAYDVTIPLPARDLIGDAPAQRRQSVEAIESLAKALLAFADQTRKRWPRMKARAPQSYTTAPATKSRSMRSSGLRFSG